MKNYKRRQLKKRKKQEEALSSPSASQNRFYIMRAALQTPSFVATTLISSISRIAKKMRGGSTPSTSSLSISTTNSPPDEPTPHILMGFVANDSSPLLEQPPASPSLLYQNNLHERDLHPTYPRIAKRLFVMDSETGEEAEESPLPYVVPRQMREGDDTFSSANTSENESADCATLEFPFLSKYGIGTNLLDEENAKEISCIFSDLEALLKKHPNASYNYTRRHMSRRANKNGTVAFSSQFNKSRYFTNAHATAQNGGLKNMINSAGKNELDPDRGEPKGARYMLDFLSKTYPKSTEHFMTETHLIDENCLRMSPEQTAAILSKANITENAWNKVICRLIHSFTGFWIGAPKNKMENLRVRMPTPTFQDYNYFQHPDINKAPEKINYWTLEIPELCEKMIERELEVLVEEDPELLPTYGYETLGTTQDGIFVIFSSDHGAGASLSAIRFLLEDSTKRREKGSADYGTVTFPFAHIACRKDPSEILELIKDNVNDGKNKLDSSKLVAVKDDKNIVRCRLIPKDARVQAVRADGNNSCVLEYIIPERGGGINRPLDAAETLLVDESLHEIVLHDFEGRNFQHWIAVQHFDTIALGDLLFALTVQGREGHASCKCMKCDLTQSEWKKGIPGIPLELGDLREDNVEIGCKTDPTWEFSPLNEWIIPLLHLGMGLANVVYWNMTMFLLNEVDSCSPEEVEIRIKANELTATLEVLRGELELYDNEYQTVSKDLTQRKASAAQRIKKIGKKLERFNNGNEQAARLNADMIARLNTEREVLEEERRSIDKQREDMKKFKTSKNKEVRDAEIKHQQLWKDVQKKVEERKKSNGGLDSQLEDVSIKKTFTC